MRLLLRFDAAQSIGLAFHELVGNALEYGALGDPEGRVSASWRIVSEPHHRIAIFDWTETGGPPLVGEPLRRGFGLELLEKALPFDIGARTLIGFDPAGLRCQIEFPYAPAHFLM